MMRAKKKNEEAELREGHTRIDASEYHHDMADYHDDMHKHLSKKGTKEAKAAAEHHANARDAHHEASYHHDFRERGRFSASTVAHRRSEEANKASRGHTDKKHITPSGHHFGDKKQYDESVEHIDEISKDKVGRYLKKAMVSTSDAGMDTASQDKDIRKRGINTFVKRRMGASDAVRKLTGKARVAATEGVEEMANWPIYKRLMEKDAHTKGATAPEEIDSKASGKEKEFRAKHKTDTVDNPEASGGDIAKATNAAPSKKARPGDNPQSDKMEKPADTTKG